MNRRVFRQGFAFLSVFYLMWSVVEGRWVNPIADQETLEVSQAVLLGTAFILILESRGGTSP